jgi:hypothetical protein
MTLQQQKPGEIGITFQSMRLPTGVRGLPGAQISHTDTRYEADVTLSGGLSGRFKGSIYPDDMNVKGRVLDGKYDVFLGFHKPGKPSQDMLKVLTNGFRPVLVINKSNALRVSSLSPAKTTSVGIHIHNGYYQWKEASPMSEGCLIIHPSHWKDFLDKFIKAFPNIADWSNNGERIGKRIGSVSVWAGVYNDLRGPAQTMLA